MSEVDMFRLERSIILDIRSRATQQPCQNSPHSLSCLNLEWYDAGEEDYNIIFIAIAS